MFHSDRLIWPHREIGLYFLRPSFIVKKFKYFHTQKPLGTDTVKNGMTVSLINEEHLNYVIKAHFGLKPEHDTN